MADKEASIYIIDLGSSMINCNNGRTESDLDWSLRYVWDKLTTTAQAKRKTWCVGVLGLRTDNTKNCYEDGQGYEHITELLPLGPVALSELNKLREVLMPSSTVEGDAMSAVLVAAEMMVAFTKTNKWSRRIYLITDGQGAMDEDDVEEIAARVNDIGIELTVLGVDFDDAQYGFKEEDKTQIKARNEATLKSLVDKCANGVFATMAEAIEGVGVPRVKFTKLVRNYDGPLSLGSPQGFPSAISIHVDRWPATKVSRPDSASTVVLRSEPSGTQSTMTLDEEMTGYENGASTFSSVQQHRVYKINDPGAPGGKRDVEYEQLSKGYEYGNTAVPIAESEWSITKLDTTKEFTIIGFVAREKVEPFVGLGEACVTVASPHDERSGIALSALVHALHELDHCAVARLVTKDTKDPVILLLRPYIEVDLECLFDFPLPFAEDTRVYRFPPLDKVLTISGKTLKKHRLLPDDRLQQSVSDFVDAMDLSGFDHDEEGKPAEYAPLILPPSEADLYSPIIHRINQAIRARAVDANAPVGDVTPLLVKYSRPPDKLMTGAKREVEALKKAANVKKAPPKVTGKRQREPSKKPISNIDIDAILAEGMLGRKKQINPDNSIPAFKQALRLLSMESDEEKHFVSAVDDMTKVIHSLIRNSMGDQHYDRALENIGVMREQLIGLEVPGLYNDFLRDLKTILKSGALGGDRRDFWAKIRYPGRLGLIHKSQSEYSDVSENDAVKFLDR